MLVQGGRWAQADTSLRLGVSATWPGSAGAKASADLPPQQQKEGCRVLLAQFCRRAQLLRSRRTPASSPSPTSLWRLCAGLPPEQSQLPSSLAKRPSLQRMRPPRAAARPPATPAWTAAGRSAGATAAPARLPSAPQVSGRAVPSQNTKPRRAEKPACGGGQQRRQTCVNARARRRPQGRAGGRSLARGRPPQHVAAAGPTSRLTDLLQ